MASSRPTSPKPAARLATSGELDDDVILYMDELPSREVADVKEVAAENDLHDLDEQQQTTHPDYMKPESITLVHSSGSRRSSSARITRLLDHDTVGKDFKVEYGGPVDEDRDVETFEPTDEKRNHPHHHHHNGKEHYPGVDDGLLESGDDDDDDDDDKEKAPSAPRHHPNETSPPFIPGVFGPNTPTPDMNVYQQKKTIAQGMMDLALISANANQFRYVLQSNDRHPFYYASLAMIGLSLFLQIVVGIGLIWNSRYNVKLDDQMCKANRANNWTVIAIFLVTILNVFISSFGVVENSAGFGFPATALTKGFNSTDTP